MIRNYFVLSILAGGIFLVAATPLLAENGAFDKMYGNGVHAFFSSDYAKAHECLSRAMDAESKDPRCFYFRGLAYLKLGREPEAREDFAVAADLEALDAYKFYNVSKALERVQGKSRMAIEQYRAKARLKAEARAAKLRRARYEELRDAETRVLQQQAKSAPVQSDLAKPLPAETAKPTEPFTAGPFEDEAPKAVAKPAAAKPATGTTDPFADAPAEPASKAVEPKKPAAKPAKPSVAKKGGGILGAIGKAVGKSLPKFGDKDGGPSKPQIIVMPKGKTPPSTPAVAPVQPVDADDPVGGKAPAPKAKKPTPTPKTPPVDPDDPFA